MLLDLRPERGAHQIDVEVGPHREDEVPAGPAAACQELPMVGLPLLSREGEGGLELVDDQQRAPWLPSAAARSAGLGRLALQERQELRERLVPGSQGMDPPVRTSEQGAAG